MADKKLTAITDTGLIGGDVVYGVRSGNSRRIRLSGAAAKDTGAFLSDTGFALSDTGFALSDTGFALSDTGIITLAATQAEQETGTSTAVYVSPGRQQFHPGSAKCLAMVTVSTGTPTLQSSTSFNITSITDTATGRLTITIATDFSDDKWIIQGTAKPTDITPDGEGDLRHVAIETQATGSVILQCAKFGSSTELKDPVEWHFVGYGDQ